MTDTYGPFCLSKDMEEQRLANLATVEAFVKLVGPDRHEKRKALYADDGRFELTFCGGPPDAPNFAYRVNDAADAAVAHGENDAFPDWSFFDVSILSTDDPHAIFTELRGRGMRYDKRWDEPHYYENHYLLCFTLKDGKIKLLREIFNPYNCMRPAGDAQVPEGF
jgi:hypothetical protein